MTAAAVIESSRASEVELGEIRRELSQLHILLLGVKADLEDALSPAPARGSVGDLKHGVRQAFACLDDLRARIDAG